MSYRVKTIALAFFITLSFSCASKKHDSQLAGLQKQIMYLTESYNKLSMQFGEVQDSLMVMQYKMEDQKNTTKVNAKKISNNSKTSAEKSSFDKTPSDKPAPQKDVAEVKEEVPIFDLGRISNDQAGKPGDIFKLDGEEGYILIGGGNKKKVSKVSKAELQKVVTSGNTSQLNNPNDYYNEAFSYYSKRKFNDAIKSFSQFLKIYPEHDLSDNALYWIGESYVGKGQYELALPEFQKVALNYPNGNKVPDALLMVGICFDNLSDKEGAFNSWQKLISRFPDSMAAKRAQKRLVGTENSQKESK